MRPRKRILLVDSEEPNISTLRLVLDANMYRPLYAPNLTAAIALVSAEPPPDLILIFSPEFKEADKIAAGLKAIARWIPIILISTRKDGDLLNAADAFLDRKIRTVDLLERVHQMSKRRRGPRRKYVLEPFTASAIAASAA